MDQINKKKLGNSVDAHKKPQKMPSCHFLEVHIAFLCGFHRVVFVFIARQHTAADARY